MQFTKILIDARAHKRIWEVVSMLTSFQRVMTAIELKEPDYVPVVPQITYTTARITGVRFQDALYSAEKMADALIAGYKMIGYDGIYVGWESSYNLVAEAMGCKLRIPLDGIPTVVEHVINDPSDVDKVKVVDPEQDGRLPIHLTAIELVRKEVGKGTPIFKYVPGPFTLAGILLDQEKFLISLVRNPDVIHNILKLSTESSKRFAVAVAEHGADVVVVADPFASTSVISPKMFDQFAFLHIKEVLKAISEAGGVPSLHICGNTTPMLERMVATGARVVELDYEVPLEYAKGKIGRSVCVEGNVNPSGALLTGKPVDIEREAKDCITKASKGGGFILSSGCEVPLDAPLENIKAMVLAAKKYGKYH